VNTSFSVFVAGDFLAKFPLYTEVLDIGNRDIIWVLPWFQKNGFGVDPIDRCLRNVDKGLVHPCSVKWIPFIFIIDLDKKPLEDGEILLIVDVRERYSRYK